MGWSCSSKAGEVIDAWRKACLASTNNQNTWKDDKGVSYFFEVSNTEHDDGAITGMILRMTDEVGPGGGRMAHTGGSFRIEGDGTVSRAPAFLKNALKKGG